MVDTVKLSIKSLIDHNLFTGPDWCLTPYEHLIISFEDVNELIIHAISPGIKESNWMSDIIDVYGKIHCYNVNDKLQFNIYTNTGDTDLIITAAQLISSLDQGDLGCVYVPFAETIVVINNAVLDYASVNNEVISVVDIHGESKQYNSKDKITAKVFK